MYEDGPLTQLLADHPALAAELESLRVTDCDPRCCPLGTVVPFYRSAPRVRAFQLSEDSAGEEVDEARLLQLSAVEACIH